MNKCYKTCTFHTYGQTNTRSFRQTHTAMTELSEAADAVFLTAAKLLDTITYRISDTGTDTSVPNNNDSLVAPLTEQLARAYTTFRETIDDRMLDVRQCRSLVLTMREKQRNAVESGNAAVDQDVAVANEDEDKQKQQQQQQAQQQQQQPNEELANDDQANDELMLDLDLDNFNFGAGAGDDAMDFAFDEPIKDVVQGSHNGQNVQNLQDVQNVQNVQNTENVQETQDIQNIPETQNVQNPPPSQSTATTAAATAGTEEYLNFGQDEELADLDLNFLEDGEMEDLLGPVDTNGAGGNANNGMNGITNGIENDKQHDDMDELFSQFDEMVGNNV